MAKKRKKISIRKTLQVLLTIIASAGCITAMISAAKIENYKTIKNVEVHISNGKKYPFIEQKEITDLAITNRHLDIYHIPLNKLDIESMESVIKTNPWVADAQVYVDNSCNLHIAVTQRLPIARIFQADGNSYYIDTSLSNIPLSESYVYYTTLVTNVPALKNDSAGTALKTKIVSLVKTIEANSFWNAQVSQIIVDSNEEFELITVLGNQRILLGDTSRIKEKLNNLFVFYKNVFNRIGWDKYQTLDVRYKDQVVASPSLPWKGPVDKAIANMNWVKSYIGTAPEDNKTVKDSTQRQAMGKKPITITPKNDIKQNRAKNAVLASAAKAKPGNNKQSQKSKPNKNTIKGNKQKAPKYILSGKQ